MNDQGKGRGLSVHLQVVGHNHREDLGRCLASCLKQTVAAPVVYVDNASTDDSAAFVRDNFPTVRVVANLTNRGYSGGNNDGLRAYPASEVVVVLNPDTTLDPDFVEKGLALLADPRVGAVAPLLLREGGKVVDAYGTRLLPTLRVVNQFEGRPVSDFVANPPWGFTGAAAFLRRRALESLAGAEEIFDEDLFAYQDDIDLTWRLRSAGWEIAGAPSARASHARRVRIGETLPDRRLARLAWRNFFLVVLKDVPTSFLLLRAPAFAFVAAARVVQLAVDPTLWPALPELLRLLPRFFKKRAGMSRRSAW